MEELGFKNAVPSNNGRPGYNPRMMLKLYIYGHLNRITTSRKLEAETHRNIEVMWLLRKLKPDDKSISDFRKDNREAIIKVLRKFVALCKQWDLFGMEGVAVDGSKFRASNSKKNNYNDKTLARRIKYLNEKIDKHMAEMDENDNGVDVCYNVQAVVDGKHKLIVDCDVINNPADHGQLSEMSIRVKNIFEVDGLKALADKGYYNADDLKICEKEKITTYVARQTFSNSTGETGFYADKFKYDKERNIYICPAGQELNCIRRKLVDENTKVLKYKNGSATLN